MTNKTVYISGVGIISPLGSGLADTENALRENRTAISSLNLFPLLQGAPLPVGQVKTLEESNLPRTHRLALHAARQAADGCTSPPDAIVLGTTTGGILTTEQLLRKAEHQKEPYRHHGLNTVANVIADELRITGPALVVSTACSSGAVAIGIGLKMLRCGQAQTVLVGGADSLSRLTYFGFHSLQLVDRNGCKPLDYNRQGMAVAEGAGMLLLTTKKPKQVVAKLLGAGITCDAYHPASPHPQGQGAFMAMQKAIMDAGLEAKDIDYINLHGTGTPDNDLAESKAIHKLFAYPPLLSSIKGAFGHSLAAAGAIEAVVSTLTVSKDLVPGNTGLQNIDADLGLSPLRDPVTQPSSIVLSNSFGFGGNNGALVIGSAETQCSHVYHQAPEGLAIHGYSCLTGAGSTASSLNRMKSGGAVSGMAAIETISENLPQKLIRRLKRLPRMTLSLAQGAHDASGFEKQKPEAVFMGSSWGALSETHDFLTRLNESEERFPSPTDFVGSVHNGPASQVAIMFGATGPNITCSGGDYSFEQAVCAAELMLDDSTQSAFILGADEGHETFSSLLDSSIARGSSLADGGAGLYVNRSRAHAKCYFSLPFYKSCECEDVMAELITSLGKKTKKLDNYVLVLAGIPASMQELGEAQLKKFIALTKLFAPVIPYRQLTGQFGSASAVAATLAASCIDAEHIPGSLVEGSDITIYPTDKILVLGLGKYITAMEFSRP